MNIEMIGQETNALSHADMVLKLLQTLHMYNINYIHICMITKICTLYCYVSRDFSERLLSNHRY